MSGLARTETDAPMPDPKATKLMMLPHKPEDWPRLFVQHLNSGESAISSNDTNFVFDTNVSF